MMRGSSSARSASTRTTCIWGRGTMISRTCMSPTRRAPSMMLWASRSITSLSAALRRAWSRSRRLRGSGEKASAIFSIQDLSPASWPDLSSAMILGAVLHPSTGLRGHGHIGVGHPQPCHDLDLLLFYLLRCGLFLVVMAQQMEHSMHHQVGPVRIDRLALGPGLPRHQRDAEHQVAQAEQGQPGG